MRRCDAHYAVRNAGNILFTILFNKKVNLYVQYFPRKLHKCVYGDCIIETNWKIVSDTINPDCCVSAMHT